MLNYLLVTITTLFTCFNALAIDVKEENTTTRALKIDAFDCPTWYHLSAGTGQCVCGSTLNGRIKCQENKNASILVRSCITYTDKELQLGICPYVPSDSRIFDSAYMPLPSNVSDINEFMCGSLNRTGLLCSQCQEGLSLAAMSYRRECVECPNPATGIVLYLALAFVPTTVFFFVVMLCSLDISSGPMNAVLIVVHVTLAKINLSPDTYLFKSSNPLSYYPVLFLMTFYGIWNLDFLRYVVPPFCIGRSLTSLQAEALEYVVAVYPLLLIVLTYICVEMYDNGYRIIVALWSPFKKTFGPILKNLNVRHSLIKTFATFLILAYTKIIIISRGLLDYTEVWNSTGVVVKTVLAIDASTPYLSAPHIPYTVLAVFMFVTFNLLPLFLLLLYPTKCFQVLLGKFPGVNWHPLRAFMDIFQGCYKNGTEGTRDCRYFASLNFVLRIVVLFPFDSQSSALFMLILLSVVFITLLAITRPYQNDIFNIWEIFVYNLFLLVNIWVLVSVYVKHYSLVIIHCAHFILFVYICIIIAAKALKTLSPRCYTACVERIKRWIKKTTFPCCCYHQEANMADMMERGDVDLIASHDIVDEDYPDRVNNPRDYESLLDRQNRAVVQVYGSLSP